MRSALPGGYELDDDRARVDRAAVHAFVGGVSDWARGRSRAVMDELIESAARVVGLYAPDGDQLGFQPRRLRSAHDVVPRRRLEWE